MVLFTAPTAPYKDKIKLGAVFNTRRSPHLSHWQRSLLLPHVAVDPRTVPHVNLLFYVPSLYECIAIVSPLPRYVHLKPKVSSYSQNDNDALVLFAPDKILTPVEEAIGFYIISLLSSKVLFVTVTLEPIATYPLL